MQIHDNEQKGEARCATRVGGGLVWKSFSTFITYPLKVEGFRLMLPASQIQLLRNWRVKISEESKKSLRITSKAWRKILFFCSYNIQFFSSNYLCSVYFPSRIETDGRYCSLVWQFRKQSIPAIESPKIIWWTKTSNLFLWEYVRYTHVTQWDRTQ